MTARRSHEIWSLRVVLGDPGFEASALSSWERVMALSAENKRSWRCLMISLRPHTAIANSLGILDSLAGQGGRFLEGLALSVCGPRNLPETMKLIGTVTSARQCMYREVVAEPTCIAHNHHCGDRKLPAPCSTAGVLSISFVRIKESVSSPGNDRLPLAWP